MPLEAPIAKFPGYNPKDHIPRNFSPGFFLFTERGRLPQQLGYRESVETQPEIDANDLQ